MNELLNIEQLRDLMTKVNRQKRHMSELDMFTHQNVYSPPFKKPENLRGRSFDNRGKYEYPRQLSGLKEKERQPLRVTGNTSHGSGGSSFPGSPTGGSYWT